LQTAEENLGNHGDDAVLIGNSKLRKEGPELRPERVGTIGARGIWGEESVLTVGRGIEAGRPRPLGGKKRRKSLREIFRQEKEGEKSDQREKI